MICMWEPQDWSIQVLKAHLHFNFSEKMTENECPSERDTGTFRSSAPIHR